MAKKRHGAEQIIPKLREAEVLLAKGMKIPQVCRKLEVTEQTYYRWRKEYGGVRLDQVNGVIAGCESCTFAGVTACREEDAR